MPESSASWRGEARALRHLTPGSAAQARELALKRWHDGLAFDLEAEQWDYIFETYDPRDILEAVTIATSSHNPRPDVIYKRFTEKLKHLAESRTPTWPPPLD